MTFVIHAHPLIAADERALTIRLAMERRGPTPATSKR